MPVVLTQEHAAFAGQDFGRERFANQRRMCNLRESQEAYADFLFYQNKRFGWSKGIGDDFQGNSELLEIFINLLVKSGYVERIFSVLALAIEDLVMYGFDTASAGFFMLAEIPLSQRDPQNAQQFKRTLRGTEPGWELKWTVKGFYESYGCTTYRHEWLIFKVYRLDDGLDCERVTLRHAYDEWLFVQTVCDEIGMRDRQVTKANDKL
jgi:hypothetical protein